MQMKRYIRCSPKCRSFCLFRAWSSEVWHLEVLVPQCGNSLEKKRTRELSSCVFMELHYIVMIDHWQLNLISSPSTLPGSLWGWDWKFQTSNHLIGSPSWQPWGGVQKLPHWHNKRNLDHSSHLGNYKGFGSCEKGTVDENQMSSYKSQYRRGEFTLAENH